MIYENKHCYLLWKPQGVPSTRGDNDCFLSYMQKGSLPGFSFEDISDQSIAETLVQSVVGFNSIEDEQLVIQHLLNTFTPTQEYGLLNRLDNDTSGFLYFAKDKETYKNFGNWQIQGRIQKRYIAKVYGNMGRHIKNGSNHHEVVIEDDRLVVSFPLMHHKQLPQRMVVITHDHLMSKGRGSLLKPITKFTIVSYNEQEETSTIMAYIQQGQRHQIRAHCSGLGYPVIGDKLYGKKGDDSSLLHLRSVGCTIT